MAYIHLQHQFPNGEELTITVGSDAPGGRGYPDELAELEARAVSIHRELVGHMARPAIVNHDEP